MKFNTKEKREKIVDDFQTEISYYVKELIHDDIEGRKDMSYKCCLKPFIVAKNNATYSDNYFTLRLKVFYNETHKQLELEELKQDKKEEIKEEKNSFVVSFPKLVNKSFTNSKSNIKELRTAIFKMNRFIDTEYKDNETIYKIGIIDIRTNKTFYTKMNRSFLDKLSKDKKSLINLASYYN